MNIYQERLERVFNECKKHILRIESSTKEMSKFMPLDSKRYENLDNKEVQIIDQFLFRFTKLQDAMEEKLFKTLLLYLDEKVENKPFIDILNRMEKIGVLESVQEWRNLRDIRNELAHNYDDDSEESSIVINNIYAKKDILIGIFNKLESYYIKRGLTPYKE